MKIKIHGIEELNKKLAATSANAEKEADAMIKTLIKKGYNTSRNLIRGGLSMAQISIRYKVSKNEGEIYTLMEKTRAQSIEEGHRPGQKPLYMRIARWVTGRRTLTARRLPELSWQERKNIEAVQKRLEITGSKGKGYISGSVEVIEKEVESKIKKLAIDIENKWER